MIAPLFALLLAVAPALMPAHAGDKDFHSADDVLAQFKNEPTIAQVQTMVLEYSKTDAHYVEGWLAASKSAAALPELTLSYGYDYKYGDNYDYIDSASTLTDGGADVGHAVDVKAKWNLDKLVMSSEEIRVINEAQDVVKLRDKVLDEVTRLYFDRRRLQVDMLLGGQQDVKTQLKNELRLEELTAQLDAYTGGRFSKAVKGS